MKVKLPKGFKLTTKSLPRFGRNIIILKKDGASYRAIRTESSFYECGYCYEDINMQDHKAEEVVAWKDRRK